MFRDALANLIGEAATDIRQKVVEEGWYGRPLAVIDRRGSSENELSPEERSPFDHTCIAFEH